MGNWKDNTKHKMLNLQLPTDPRWADIAGMNIADILVDHAYCEQKAASSCISLILKFPDLDRLVDVLTPVVAEEWVHFEQVMAQIRKRGITFGWPRKDEYVLKLSSFVKKGGNRMQQLTELLLMNALIEARSCERFKLLWQNLTEEELRNFYYELMVSEAGHYVNFLELARFYQESKLVEARWQEWLAFEAEVIRNLAIKDNRIH